MASNQTTVNTGNWPIEDETMVYGTDGEKLGTVRNYDPQAGYLDVQKGWLFTKDFYVPLSAVETITGEGLTLHLTKEDLEDERYASPPVTGGVVYGETFVITDTTLSAEREPIVEREDVTVMSTAEGGPL
jgi:hypothetical protein